MSLKPRELNERSSLTKHDILELIVLSELPSEHISENVDQSKLFVNFEG